METGKLITYIHHMICKMKLGLVPFDCLKAENLIDIALQDRGFRIIHPSVVNHLKTEYQETDESLRRFDVECELMAEGEPYYWTFHLVTCEFYGDVLDDYQVKVDALTGEILDGAAYDEGNG